MIRIAESSKVILLKPEGLDEAAYKLDLAAAGAEVSALIIECVYSDAHPVCPSCRRRLYDDSPPKGAGLMECRYCAELLVTIRVLGGRRGVAWYSFPWPK